MEAKEPSRPPVVSSTAPGAAAPAVHQHVAPSSQRSGVVPSSQRSGVPSSQRSGVPSSQRSGIPSTQRSGVPYSQRSGVVGGDRLARGRSDQYHNPLKAPLLKKVHARSRHITREESRVKHTWVYASTLCAIMGNIALGYGLGFTSPTQEAMQAELNLSTSEFSTFGSLITLGAMAGAAVSGLTADYFGRRGGLRLVCVPCIAGFLLISFAQSTTLLYIGRIATGVAGGIVCFIVPTFIGETAPRHLRGFLSAMQQFSCVLGVFIAYAVGIFLPWRILAAAGTIPCVLSLVGFIFIPESPHWLASVDRHEELASALQFLRGKDYNISREFSETKAAAETIKQQPKSKFTDVFAKRYRRPLLAGCGVQMAQQITGINGVMLYSTAIFLAAGVPSATLAALSIAALQVIVTLISAGLVDKAGRRLLLLVSTSGMALSLFLVGLAFYLKGIEEEGTMSAGMEIFIDILALSCLLVFIGAFAIGLGPIPWVLVAEIFPNHVKANAGSLASLVNWSTAWVITLTFNFFFEWSNSGTFWLFAFISLCAAIFVALFVPETRGKTLDQIEESFNK